MVVKKLVCDRCSVEIEGERLKEVLETQGLEGVHLCVRCRQMFSSILKTFLETRKEFFIREVKR